MKPEQSDTPKTDAEWEKQCFSGESWYIIAGNMRSNSKRIERELNEANRQLTTLKAVADGLAKIGSHARWCESKQEFSSPCNCGFAEHLAAIEQWKKENNQ